MQEHIYILFLVVAVVAAFVLSLFNMTEAAVEIVTEVERMLGGGTGQLKLRKAYVALAQKWGWLPKLLPYKLVVAIIEAGLKKAKLIWSQNKEVAAYVHPLSEMSDVDNWPQE